MCFVFTELHSTDTQSLYPHSVAAVKITYGQITVSDIEQLIDSVRHGDIHACMT